jgi:hypothetical protein
MQTRSRKLRNAFAARSHDSWARTTIDVINEVTHVCYRALFVDYQIITQITQTEAAQRGSSLLFLSIPKRRYKHNHQKDFLHGFVP